jgi:hypothetical protein
MAFTQKPGRSPFLKTGNGIPSALMQDIELTKDYDKGKKKMAEARAKHKNTGPGQGINIDPKSGVATAMPYNKKFIKGGKFQNAKIVSEDGKKVKVAPNTGDRRTQNESLYNEYKKDSTMTMNSRNRNANFYNVTGGGKSPESFSEADKEMMVRLGKAIKK